MRIGISRSLWSLKSSIAEPHYTPHLFEPNMRVRVLRHSATAAHLTRRLQNLHVASPGPPELTPLPQIILHHRPVTTDDAPVSMNGCGARWLKMLSRSRRWYPAGAPYLRKLPYFVRSLSHGSRLLSRVRRREPVSSRVDAAPEESRPKGCLRQSEANSIGREISATDAPPDDTKPFSGRRIIEMKDAEGRAYCESAIFTSRTAMCL